MEKRPLKILIIENDPVDVELAQEFFKDLQAPVEVFSVNNGEEGIQYLKKHGAYVDAQTPDVVLLDLHMPVKDGYETLEEIRQDVSLSTVPVVVLTGSEDDASAQRLYDLGASCFITKPIAYDQWMVVQSLIRPAAR